MSGGIGEFEREYAESIRTICLEDDDEYVAHVRTHNATVNRLRDAHALDMRELEMQGHRDVNLLYNRIRGLEAQLDGSQA